MKHRFELRFKDELLETCTTPRQASDALRKYESRKRQSGFVGLIEIIDTEPQDEDPAAWAKKHRAARRT